MTQVCFEDVAAGDLVPALNYGPLSPVHLMRWSSAIENWHRIHYDRAFAIERDGLPDLLVNGSLKQQFVLAMLKRWAGSQGWVWKVRFEMRAMNVVGETLSVWARVAGVRRSSAHGLVELELGVVNENGTESMPGVATVALPYRNGPPVPYPFTPPID